MSKNMKALIEANKADPVVYGSCQIPGRKAYFRLVSGATFRLGKADIEAWPAGWSPVWRSAK